MALNRQTVNKVMPHSGRPLSLQKQGKNVLQSKKNTNLFECNMCTQFNSNTLEDIVKMVAHINNDHLKMDIRCRFEGCDFTGLEMADMRRHYSKIHLGNEVRDAENTTCFLCGTRKQSERELLRHTRIVHLKDNEYFCIACEDFATFSLKEWSNHVNQRHADNPPKIKFHRNEDLVPTKSFTQSMTVNSEPDREKISVVGRSKTKQTAPVQRKVKSEVLYKCFRCPEKFLSKLALLQHIKSKHTDIMNGVSKDVAKDKPPIFYFLCTLCDKKALSDEDIQKHVIESHFKASNSICPHCPHFGSSPTDLSLHVQQKHYKHFSLCKVICGICDFGYSNLGALQVHVRKCHGLEAKEKHVSGVLDTSSRYEKRKLEEQVVANCSKDLHVRNVPKASRVDKGNDIITEEDCNVDIASGKTKFEIHKTIGSADVKNTNPPVNLDDMNIVKEIEMRDNDLADDKKPENHPTNSTELRPSEQDSPTKNA